MSLAVVGVSQSRLEYGVAFNLAACYLSGRVPSGRLVLLATSPIFVGEWQVRFGHSSTILTASSDTARAASVNGWTVVRATADGQTMGEEELGSVTLSSESMANDGVQPMVSLHAGALWASPRTETWREDLHLLDAILNRDAPLVVVTGGALGLILGASRRGIGTGEPRGTIAGLASAIRALDYTIVDDYAIGGIDTVAWALLGRFATAVHRADIADRCEAGYRGTLVPKPSRSPAMLRVIVAQKSPELR